MWCQQSPVPQHQMEEAIQENPAIKDTFTPRISRDQIVQEIDHSQVGVAYLEGEPTAIFIAAAGTMDKLYLEAFLQQRGVKMVWWTLQMGPLPEVPLMDLDPARYAAILNNIMPELQDLWEGLADIARQRASPESRRTAQALQQVHASDYKVFLTKFLLLGQNWEHIPALRTALGNWACDCVFEHALTLVKRELAQQRDTAWGGVRLPYRDGAGHREAEAQADQRAEEKGQSLAFGDHGGQDGALQAADARFSGRDAGQADDDADRPGQRPLLSRKCRNGCIWHGYFDAVGGETCGRMLA